MTAVAANVIVIVAVVVAAAAVVIAAAAVVIATAAVVADAVFLESDGLDDGHSRMLEHVGDLDHMACLFCQVLGEHEEQGNHPLHSEEVLTLVTVGTYTHHVTSDNTTSHHITLQHNIAIAYTD